jgi:hypothetical protein
MPGPVRPISTLGHDTLQARQAGVAECGLTVVSLNVIE